jgi:hypothetical protein
MSCARVRPRGEEGSRGVPQTCRNGFQRWYARKRGGGEINACQYMNQLSNVTSVVMELVETHRCEHISEMQQRTLVGGWTHAHQLPY